MRIAFFLHDYGLSGANLSWIDYIKDYNQNEHSIIVFVPFGMKDSLSAQLADLKIEFVVVNGFVLNKELDKKPIKYKIKKAVKKIFNFFFLKRALKKATLIIQQTKVDLIVSNSVAVLWGAEIAKELGKKHVFHVREFMELDHKITYNNPRKAKQLIEYSSAIFISKCIQEYYLNRFSISKYQLIYNKVSYEANLKKRNGQFLEGKDIKLIIVGSLQEGKGQIDAIRAVKLLSPRINVKLFVCGVGPDEDKLKRYCHDNKIKEVEFLGQLPREKVLLLRNDMDISLTCSKNEALGRTTIEAMYYENLCIGADGGETPYLLENRGLTYTFGNYEELAEKILYAINHKDYCIEVIKKAKVFSIDFFSKPIVSTIFSFFERV